MGEIETGSFSGNAALQWYLNMSVCCLAVGSVLWSQNYDSPVVAMYQMDAEFGGLRRVTFVNVALETLQHMSGQLTEDEWRDRFLKHTNNIQTF